MPNWFTASRRAPAAQIAGRVADSDGKPVAGARVQPFAVRMRGEKPFGPQVISDADGQYSIGVKRSAENGAARPNIRVAVLDAESHELTSSSVRYGVETNGSIDLTLQNRVGRPSEFERYAEAVKPLLDGVKLFDAITADVAFLAGDTGIPASHLQGLVEASLRAGTANDASADAGVFPPDVWYGWKSAGFDLAPGSLWQRPTDELIDALRTAVDTASVPARITDDLETIRTQIDEVKLDIVLQAPAPGTTAGLGNLLATVPVPLDLSQRRVIAGAVTELRPDDPQLVERIAAIPGFNGDASGVARALRLGELTAGHLPMVEALQSRLKATDDSEGTLSPLAALSEDEWLDLAYTHGTPDAEAIDPVAYADRLATVVEEQHPTAALAAHLLEGRGLARQPVLADVGAFLRDNPTFDIATANVDALDQAKLDGVADRDRLQQGLVALQLLNTLGARWDEAATLFENNVSSPPDILAAGPTQLTALLEGQIPAQRVAELYGQVEDLHNNTFAGFTEGP
jgi:hypothetical protein